MAGHDEWKPMEGGDYLEFPDSVNAESISHQWYSPVHSGSATKQAELDALNDVIDRLDRINESLRGWQAVLLITLVILSLQIAAVYWKLPS